MTAAVSSQVLVRPGSVRAWVLACRPATLTAALTPVAVGTAVAFHEGMLKVAPAVAALIGALLLQVGSNFANDVFDFEKGADTEERLGPTRAVQAGLVTPGGMRIGMAIVFGLALCVGVYLTQVAGWPVVAIGLASIAAAIAYTGGPFPLGYHGLGDVFVMLFFGFVAVCGTVFVQGGQVPVLAWIAAIPVGSLATNILVVNNLRDRETDVRAGKRTLAVRFGKRGALIEYMALAALAYLVPLGLIMAGVLGPIGFLPCLTMPIALHLVRRVATETGRSLNGVLVLTAKLVFFHGILFAIAIAGDALVGRS
jgi:1,4-dihydroxy-2-naphthoate octaprenyltransferase